MHGGSSLTMEDKSLVSCYLVIILFWIIFMWHFSPFYAEQSWQRVSKKEGFKTTENVWATTLKLNEMGKQLNIQLNIWVQFAIQVNVMHLFWGPKWWESFLCGSGPNIPGGNDRWCKPPRGMGADRTVRWWLVWRVISRVVLRLGEEGFRRNTRNYCGKADQVQQLSGCQHPQFVGKIWPAGNELE